MLQDSEFSVSCSIEKPKPAQQVTESANFAKSYTHPVSPGMFGKALSADFTGLIVARVFTSIAA